MLFTTLLAFAPLVLALGDKAQHDLSRSRARAHYARSINMTAPGVELAKRDTYSGRATYYAVGQGACGIYNVASDWIVALNSAQYGSGYPGPECGKSITISYGGKTAVATIEDECPTCSYGDLDLSEGLFTQFAATSVGQFEMTWWYNDGSSSPSSTTTSTTPAYTPPTSTYTPPSSTYTPPTSTYTPPTTTATPTTTSTPSTTSTSTTLSTSTSVGSSSATITSSVTLNSTTIPPYVIVSNSTSAFMNSTATTTATIVNPSATGALATVNNLVFLNQAVAQYGRIIVVGAGGD